MGINREVAFSATGGPPISCECDSLCCRQLMLVHTCKWQGPQTADVHMGWDTVAQFKHL